MAFGAEDEHVIELLRENIHSGVKKLLQMLPITVYPWRSVGICWHGANMPNIAYCMSVNCLSVRRGSQLQLRLNQSDRITSCAWAEVERRNTTNNNTAVSATLKIQTTLSITKFCLFYLYSAYGTFPALSSYI